MGRDAWTADEAARVENYWAAACAGPLLLTAAAYWGTAYAVSGSGAALWQLAAASGITILFAAVLSIAFRWVLRPAGRAAARVTGLSSSPEAAVCVGFTATAALVPAAAAGYALGTGAVTMLWLGPLTLPGHLAAQAVWGWAIGRAAVGPGRAAGYPGWGSRVVRPVLLTAGGAAVAALLVGGYRLGEAQLGARVAAEDRLVALTARVGGAATRAAGGPFRVVTAVDLSGSRVTDADVPTLAGLDAVESLDLSRTAVSGVGLDRVLAGMPHLRRLNLSGARVTDEALTALGPHPTLAELDLSDTPLTDRAAAGSGLLRSPGMRHLRLDGTKVTREAAGSHLSRDGLKIVVGGDGP